MPESSQIVHTVKVTQLMRESMSIVRIVAILREYENGHEFGLELDTSARGLCIQSIILAEAVQHDKNIKLDGVCNAIDDYKTKQSIKGQKGSTPSYKKSCLQSTFNHYSVLNINGHFVCDRCDEDFTYQLSDSAKSSNILDAMLSELDQGDGSYHYCPPCWLEIL